MANVTTELKVVVKAVGQNELKQLQGALTDLGRKAAEPAKINFKELSVELKKVQNTTRQTVSNLQAYSNAWKDIARNVEIGSKEFKEATAEAAKLDKQLSKVQARPSGGRLRAGAQIAGTVAGAGVFGGPEGAIGALAGAALGFGAPGAIVGGAIGAQVGQFRQAAGATAEYAASLSKLRIALKGVTTSQVEYQESLAFIQQTTKDFAIPQEVVTRQFTKLQASVQGAGGNIEDTKTAFNGIVAAVRATGGSLADVDAALTATAQVFSKGKVSAEELRQQIGERLPGAFTLFAEAIGMTPQELDKALEKGQVSLQDFQKFAEAIFERYGENAKTIADAPESAGDRLKVALEELSGNIGTLLGPIGKAFQQTFEEIVRAINQGIVALQNFLGIGTKGAINKAQRELDAATKGFERFLGADREDLSIRERAAFDRVRNRLTAALTSLEEAKRAEESIDIQQPDAGTGLPGITPGLSAGSKEKTDNLEERIRLSEQALNLARADLEVQDQIDSLDRIRIKAFRDILELQFKVQNALENETNEIVRRNIEEENRLRILGRQSQLFKDLNREAQDRFNTFFKLTKAQDDAFADAQKRFNNFYKQTTSKLTDTQKLIQSIGGVISGGLTSAFQSLITGAKSLKEILADVLGQIGQLFIQFAVRQALGAINIGGVPLVPSAKGNVFAQNKIIPYANGGVIDKPTILPLAGEAGPEAILPLQRGGDGKLGVKLNESRMRESMARYSPRQRDAMPAFDGNTDGAIDAANAASATGAIDVRYTVERINSVDYVTADQFQRGMQQAASQGAKQGEQQTLKRLQMSGSTRKRLGM